MCDLLQTIRCKWGLIALLAVVCMLFASQAEAQCRSNAFFVQQSPFVFQQAAFAPQFSGFAGHNAFFTQAGPVFVQANHGFGRRVLVANNRAFFINRGFGVRASRVPLRARLFPRLFGLDRRFIPGAGVRFFVR